MSVDSQLQEARQKLLQTMRQVWARKSKKIAYEMILKALEGCRITPETQREAIGYRELDVVRDEERCFLHRI